MLEAAGIEPDTGQSTSSRMVLDSRLKAPISGRFSPPIESPGVPSCPLESPRGAEISWRCSPSVFQTLLTHLGAYTLPNSGASERRGCDLGRSFIFTRTESSIWSNFH
jgi:hypothetical protein